MGNLTVLAVASVLLLIGSSKAAEPFGDWRVEANRDRYSDKETVFAATYATKTNASQKPVFAFACGDALGPPGSIGITFVWQNNGPIQESRVTVSSTGVSEVFDVGVLGARREGVGVRPDDYARLLSFIRDRETFDISARMTWGGLTATFSTRGMKAAFERLQDACGGPKVDEVPAQVVCPAGTQLVLGSNPPICRRQ